MSAWLCDDDTFDLIATVAIRHDAFAWHSDRTLDAARVATILRDENIRSLRARYDERAEEYWTLDAPYVFRPVLDARAIDPVVVLKQLNCLEYQSCESDDYETTLAHKLLVTIRNTLIAALPGYEAAPWGWQRPEVAA